MSDLTTRFAQAMAQCWPQAERRVVVAVSGGSDSTALLCLAQEWATVHGVDICAVTVDHGLRAESAQEALQVAQLAERLGIEHHILCDTTWSPQGNLQADARQFRYETLASIAQTSPVLLGHTQDDQAETFLLRLARGSGVDGLSAMRPVSQIETRNGHVTLIRPLLGVAKEALRQSLRDAGIGWIEDPSNENAAFDRVKIRALQQALAECGITPYRLARTADAMAQAKEALHNRVIEASSTCVTDYAPDLLVDLGALREWDKETQTRLISLVLRYVGGDVYPPSRDGLERFLDQLYAGKTAVLAQVLAHQNPDIPQKIVYFTREPRYVDAYMGHGLWDRRWRIPRDGLCASGAVSIVQMTQEILSSLEFEWTIPHPARLSLPVVLCDEALVWHGGMERDQPYSLQPRYQNFKEFLHRN